MRSGSLLPTNKVTIWVIFTIAMGEIWPIPIVIIPTGDIDVSNSHNNSNRYC
jgi:hypothetical protein